MALGKGSEMQDPDTPKKAGSASISRRSFIAIAAAGSAATLPAVALAEASGKTSRLPQPTPVSLGQQLDICIANLRNVLAAMHPGAIVSASHEWSIDRDDDFYVFRIEHRTEGGRS
jgi:hypothetical protein